MPLKRARHTVNVPGEIEALMQKRKTEEKYRSVSDYFVSLLVFDIYARRKHVLTAQLMNEPREIQDKVFEELRESFDKPDAKPGSWFEHRIDELLNERRVNAEVVTDSDGRITAVNRQFSQMCGYSLKELLGKTPGEVLRPKTLAVELPILRRFRLAIREHQPFACTLTNYRKNGSAYRVNIKMQPMFKNGQHIGFRADEEIVSERK